MTVAHWFFVIAAVVFAIDVAAADRAPDPYEQCKKTAKNEKDCRQYLSPERRAQREKWDEQARQSQQHLEQRQRQDCEAARRGGYKIPGC